jgi:hypothetical protein
MMAPWAMLAVRKLPVLADYPVNAAGGALEDRFQVGIGKYYSIMTDKDTKRVILYIS